MSRDDVLFGQFTLCSTQQLQAQLLASNRRWHLPPVSVPPTPSYQQGTPCWARQHSSPPHPGSA